MDAIDAMAVRSFVKEDARSTTCRSGLKPLSEHDMRQVHGGLLPFLAAAYSVATGYAVRSFSGYVVHRASAIYTVFGAAKHYGGENYGGTGSPRDPQSGRH